MYEVERGKECFVGRPCIWNGKDILTDKLVNGALNGTRILIQNDHLTTVKDMLHSTWLALVTYVDTQSKCICFETDLDLDRPTDRPTCSFTSVGYGRIVPTTAMGKMIAMVAMVFGACYTAMPLTLVGGQFYLCYQESQQEHELSMSSFAKVRAARLGSLRKNLLRL